MRRVHDDAHDRTAGRSTPIAKVDPKAAETDGGLASADPIGALVESLQRNAGNAAVSRLLQGEALPPSIKAAGERRLGSDLSDVRVHSDASSATFAESLGAEAVTVGKDVFMSPRPGGFDTSKGRQTLMHELAHTAQSPGASDAPVVGVSSPGSSAEREASSIGSRGFSGPMVQPTQIATPGIVHRKVADDEEVAPDDQKMPDFLNPEPLTEDEQRAGGVPMPPKAGELGENESIAFEIRVLAPLRGVLAAVSETEWETATERLNSMGEALWEYEQAYQKSKPALSVELRGIRGWLALAASQIRGRYSGRSFTDDHIASLVKEALDDMESLGKRLDSPA